MKKKNYFKILLLITCFSLSITPLFAGGEAEKGAEAKKKAEEVSITFLTPPWGAPPDKELLEEFEAEHGINVEVIAHPLNEVYSKIMLASVNRKSPADVFYEGEEGMTHVVTPGYAEPLDKYIEKWEVDINDFVRWDDWVVDQKIYGIPNYAQLVMMDYNEEKLHKAGFSSPPETWNQLVEMASQIKKSGIEEYPVSFGAISWSWYLIALSMGDEMFDSQQQPVFDRKGSPARDAMRLLMDMFRESELISPSIVGKPHDMFLGGIGTFHQSWQGAYNLMNNPEVSSQAPNIRYMLFPDTHYTWDLDSAVGISKYSPNKEAAWEFVKWYVGRDNQVAILQVYGLTPSRRSVQEYCMNQGLIHQYDVQVEQAKYVRPLPRDKKWWGEWDTYINDILRKGIQGYIEPDAIVDDLSNKWNELRTKYE